ncbi:MAG: DNA-binding protein [Nitrospinae bacterium]|nr:DNA-binding protein [Nitrospinota bacterium]
MRKINVLAVLMPICVLCLAVDSFAQGRMWGIRGGGWGHGSQYCAMYDTQAVETISGKVMSVDKITPMRGMNYGIHLMVKTEKEEISVHLGPGWFLENQDMAIETNDQVEITGSRITYEGKPALIAAEVKKGGNVLVLRDKNGFPAWSGWRRR